MPSIDNALGKIPCLVCQTPVVLRANKNALAYFGCAECGCQVMTRARAADVKLRKLLPAAAPAPTPPALPASTTTKKDDTRETKTGPAAPAAAQPAAAGGRRLGVR